MSSVCMDIVKNHITCSQWIHEIVTKLHALYLHMLGPEQKIILGVSVLEYITKLYLTRNVGW